MFNGVHSDRHIFGMTGCRLGIYQPNEPQKKTFLLSIMLYQSKLYWLDNRDPF